MFAAMAGESGCRPEEIAAMAAALPGRGELLSRADPTHAVWIDTSAAFAAATRGLPVLPEDPLDTQPSVDVELIFVCRARLDDRAGLLQLLQIDSTRGAALSDAQILRQCYKRWREETPRFVYGDFAFVAWERWSRRTVAATDHLGNFPLFYCRSGRRVLFATQLGALLACPNVRARLDPQCLKRAAAGQPVHGRTMFEGIEVLQGGHLLVQHDDVLRLEKWWRPDTAAREVHAHARDYVEEARVLFDSAVASRLRARGGVVATLGGGLDSGLVAVTAASQLSASGKVLETLTAMPRDDEAWATAIADFQPNIRQRLVSTGDTTPLDVLPLAHELAHTPVYNPADLVWAWQMTARAAHNRVRVILCADHGNRSIGYAGDLCDAHFIRLRRLAGAAQQTWDRVRCIGSGISSWDDEPHTSERQMFVRAMLTSRTTTRVDFHGAIRRRVARPHGRPQAARATAHLPPAHLPGWQPASRPRPRIGPWQAAGERTAAACAGRAICRPDGLGCATAGDYRLAFQGLRDSAVCAEFLNLSSLSLLLETLCAGNGTTAQAATLHHALDAGLFAAALESKQGIATVERAERNAPTSPLFESVADMRRISSAH